MRGRVFFSHPGPTKAGKTAPSLPPRRGKTPLLRAGRPTSAPWCVHPLLPGRKTTLFQEGVRYTAKVDLFYQTLPSRSSLFSACAKRTYQVLQTVNEKKPILPGQNLHGYHPSKRRTGYASTGLQGRTVRKHDALWSKPTWKPEASARQPEFGAPPARWCGSGCGVIGKPETQAWKKHTPCPCVAVGCEGNTAPRRLRHPTGHPLATPPSPCPPMDRL